MIWCALYPTAVGVVYHATAVAGRPPETTLAMPYEQTRMRSDNCAANRGDNWSGQGHRQQSIANRPYPVKANTDKSPYNLRHVEVPSCGGDPYSAGTCQVAHASQKEDHRHEPQPKPEKVLPFLRPE